jgi:6-phosphogluconolactonase (cycloisomerase 2 family)
VKINLSALLICALPALAACPLTIKYTIGGTITGLQGTGLVLQDNGGSNFTPTTNGTFTFSDKVANNDAYSVTVATQPSSPAQTCTVHNASGTVDKTNIVNVIVNCTQAGRYAYVANQRSDTISAFLIDSTTGGLTQIAGSPYTSIGSTPAAVAVDPNGTFLYVAENGTNTLSMFAINNDTGLLTAQNSTTLTGTNPDALAFHPSGAFLYAANFGSNSVSAYAVDAASGALTPLAASPYAAGVEPSSLKVDANGNYLYATNAGGETVSVFAIDSTTGELTSVAGSPFSTGSAPVSIVLDPTGSYAYVANATGDSISEFSVNASTGGLSVVSGSPLATTTEPLALAADPQGRYVYVANVTAANQVSSYGIAPTSGALSVINSANTGTFPAAIAVDPSGSYVYVAGENSNSLSVYSVSSGGSLTLIGTPLATGDEPSSIAID